MMNLLQAQAAAMAYPEREETRESIADRIWARALFSLHQRFHRHIADPALFAAAVAARAARVPNLPLDQLVPDLRYRMRRTLLSDDLLAECFALYTVARGDALPPSVLAAARGMMQGQIVELAEREDRRQALALAAAAMAVHGTPVHLLAASGARACALAQAIQAPFAALGFRVALVAAGADGGERQDACSRLVLCGTLRGIGLDYLRDRIALGGRQRAVVGGLDRIAGDARLGHKLLLLGMQCALVEDADEVMLDDSGAPIGVAMEAEAPEERQACRLSGRRVVLAQMTVPRVLGRYLHLAGTCGDARGMEGDFWRMYRLRTVRAGTHPQPLAWNARLFAKAAWKRTALLEDARERAASGAVVIATHSAPEAQALFAAGRAAGIDLALVRGTDDAPERQAIARLDHPGAVLISVYPAQRAVSGARGPVPRHLIVADLHDAERHIVQIANAHGADSCTIFVSLEDESLKARLTVRALSSSARAAAEHGETSSDHAKRRILDALRTAERALSHARRDALSLDRNLDDLLAFSGRRE